MYDQYEMKSLLKGQESQEDKKKFSMKERKFSMNAYWNDSQACLNADSNIMCPHPFSTLSLFD